MATTDLSRSAFDPRKRYAAVQMQQGRVMLDADWNESAAIAADAARRALLDIVGPHGTQDDGLRIASPTIDSATNTIDFTIGAGSYYVGGLRTTLEAAESYRLQADWLEQTPAASPTANRRDLVYVELWQQPVGAVEDEELREVALGGPDTSTRLRTMSRVAIEVGVAATDCADAWAEAAARWSAAGQGTLTSDQELATDVTLTVSYVEGDDGDDLCDPAIAGGYLGAENQAIRVQLVDDATFTWGFDNASPLYRADLAADRTTLTLRNAPPDQVHWPLAGDVVEVLAWSALLPNGEKAAEISGHLTTVATSYQPDAGTLGLTDAVPATLDAWTSRGDAAALGAAFYYLRVWHRGSERDEPPAIACPAGTAVTLGHTGISVTLSAGARRAGDHWIIAARPESPDQVVPWDLEQGRLPHGIRRYRAPLALVRWKYAEGDMIGEILSDCRMPFHPLTDQRDCVTYTVGDGSHSHGDFSTIQAAIEALPETGGEVRVLRGDYHEAVHIADRHDVTIAGCGDESRLTALGDGTTACHIERSERVTICGLAIEALDAPCVTIGGPGEDVQPSAPLGDVELAELTLVARDYSAVTARGGRGITLRDNRVTIVPLAADLAADERGRWPAFFLASDDVHVERNEIRTQSTGGTRRAALGGIQLAGGVERARVIENAIVGGNGHGVTLGSVVYVPETALELATTNWLGFMQYATFFATGFEISVDENGCVQWTPVPPSPTGGDGTVLVPVSEGSLSDVEIRRNEITDMGGSGISVARFFDLTDRPDCIDVSELRIEGNTITTCLQGEIAEVPAQMRTLVGYGGIALAGVVRGVIRDNRVEGNGRSHLDPVCGVFVLHAEGIELANNRLIGNGPRTATSQSPRPGQRGGIVITLAGPPEPDNVAGGAREARIAAACRIVDNEVVAPEGRALRLTAVGAVTVSRNYLASLGFAERATHGTLNAISVGGALAGADARTTAGLLPAALDFLGGGAVAILDLGTPADTTTDRVKTGSTGAAAASAAAASNTGGALLFHDNHVVLSLSDAEAQPPQTAVVLLSLDDASIQQNHFEIDHGRVLVNLYAYGSSVRVADNRMSEPLRQAGILLSALTVGTMNTTTGNQGTHCIVVKGDPDVQGLVVDEQNRSLFGAISSALCEALGAMTIEPGAWIKRGGTAAGGGSGGGQSVLTLLG